MDKYYKVVDADLRSIATSYFAEGQEHLSVQYKLGEWVEAPSINDIPTKLFVFDNIDSAIKMGRQYNGKIFKCEVTNPTKGFPCDRISQISNYWKIFLKRIFHEKTINLPHERTSMPSVLVSSVKLLMEI